MIFFGLEEQNVSRVQPIYSLTASQPDNSLSRKPEYIVCHICYPRMTLNLGEMFESEFYI